MNQFTASNGVEVSDAGGSVLCDGFVVIGAGSRFRDAIREFFQHERDEELGRWRWPDDPGITVREAPAHARDYRYPGLTVMIQQDSDGYVGYYTRDRLPDITDQTGGIVRAGHAYFQAKGDPKPWHEAKPGEVWVVTWTEGTFPLLVADFAVEGRVFADAEEMVTLSIDEAEITEARRIYPEDNA